MEMQHVITINDQQNALSDVEIDVFLAEPTSFRGDISLYKESDKHFTSSGWGGTYLELPSDVPVIVTARKPGYLPDSVSVTPRNGQGM